MTACLVLAVALGAIPLASMPGTGVGYQTPAPGGPTHLESAALLAEATIRAAEFDLAGAAAAMSQAARRGEAATHVASLYLRGLVDAREAFRQGGSDDALAPVRQAVASLERFAGGRPGVAEIARLTLQAAAAAAQSEREEMRLYLESAIEMESLQRGAGLPGAPLVSASEVAGDLWLQVHDYEEARRAFSAAAASAGPTFRVLAGLAQSARRLDDRPGTCAAYRRLLESWGSRAARPAQVIEAREYVVGCDRVFP